LESTRKFLFALLFVAMLMVLAVECLYLRNTGYNVSTVEATGNIGVYWDENCSKQVDPIDWGTLSPGEVKEVTIWVRNEANQPLVLTLNPTDWSPANASGCLFLSWGNQFEVVEAGEVIRIILRLEVAWNTIGFSSFSFNIVLNGREYLPGDLNKDGVVDVTDLGFFGFAFGSTPGDYNWNIDADLNEDGVVDSTDLGILSTFYGSILGR
jgi:hypothetical protein